MRQLDLFSGIGGFALAASRVWGDEHEIVAFCEIDTFCQKRLAKNFPNTRIYEDIRTLSGFDFRGIDLLTGGFPCQPYSVAGKQRGAEDDRALWSEMFRIITEARPRWVIGENVAGIIKLALDSVLSDLESAGYTVQTLSIPACAVGAKHRRERIWIVAHTDREREQQPQRHFTESGGRLGNGSATLATDTDSTPAKYTLPARRDFPSSASAKRLASHPARKRRCEGNNKPNEPSSPSGWALTEPPLCRRGHGIPNRVDRVRALGNAIVPQVAEEIFRAIQQVEHLSHGAIQ